jgi:hypothetical protein
LPPALSLLVFLLALSVSAHAQQDWPMFGHDDGSTRFSPLVSRV